MDEDRFELALEEVDCKEDAGECLELRRFVDGILVDVGSPKVEKWMNEQRPEILNDEDCLPCDLETLKLLESARQISFHMWYVAYQDP